MSQFSYTAIYEDVVPANGKFMATLFNTSTDKFMGVVRISAWQEKVGAIIGVVLQQRIWKIASRTAGTGVIIYPYDSLLGGPPSGISADTGSSAVSIGDKITKFAISTEEHIAAGGLGIRAHNQYLGVVWEKHPAMSPLLFGQNEGISIENATVSVLGSVNYVIDFITIPKL